jgi:hypothetical protein
MKVHLLCPSYCYLWMPSINNLDDIKRNLHNCIDIFDRATSMLSLTNCKHLWATLRSSPSSVSQILRQSKKFLIQNHTKTCKWAFFPSKWIKHDQKTPCLQMLSWKLHVRMSVSPRKLPFIVFITPSIQNKNGGDRLRKTSISSIFEEEYSKTAGFGKCKQADLDFV